MKGHDLPKHIHEWMIGKKIKHFSYSTNEQEDQIIYVTIILEGTGRHSMKELKLGITLDCDEGRHSLAFVV